MRMTYSIFLKTAEKLTFWAFRAYQLICRQDLLFEFYSRSKKKVVKITLLTTCRYCVTASSVSQQPVRISSSNFGCDLSKDSRIEINHKKGVEKVKREFRTVGVDSPIYIYICLLKPHGVLGRRGGGYVQGTRWALRFIMVTRPVS